MKILADMNIPLKYIQLFINKDIDITHWSNIGNPNATDIEIMEYADINNYSILTCDLDFSAILSVTKKLKPSIIQVRASIIYADRAVDLIVAVLHRYKNEISKGAILSLELKKSRVRLLPI